ncbi:MAG: hypothetical protein WBG46_12370 [Nonlabens sp.]
MKLFCVIFLTLLSSFCGAQTVFKGKLLGKEGSLITNGYVISKYQKSDEQIVEYVSVINGYYLLRVDKVYNDSIYLEARISGYENKMTGFKYSDIENKTSIYDFELKKKIDSLEQIVIKRELPKKVIVKQDTISYDVSQIADLEDRKLKDVIDNIPNLEYNESTGEIKYKGKSIKTVTINGNNLVDANYALIAKNLNLDMIDRLEAIDNYSDNPITSRYSSSDDKSLNVVLKKNAYQLSAGLEGMAGLFEEEHLGGAISSTPSIFNEKLNSFNYVGANDISINPSTIDIYDIASSYEYLKSSNIIAPLFNSRFTSANFLGNNRSVINETRYISANANYQFAQGTSLKLNVDHLDDTHKIDRLDRTQFNVENEIENSLSSNTKYSPSFSSFRLEYRKLTSKDLLEIKSNIQQNESSRDSKLLRNDQERFQLDEDQDFKSLVTSVEYSLKINNKNAVQLSGTGIFQNNGLNFEATPNLLSTGTSSVRNIQNYSIDKRSIEFNAIYYLELERNKLISSVSFKNRNEQFDSFSNLTSDDRLNTNEISLENLDLNFNNSYSFKAGRFKFSAFSTLTIVNQSLESDRYLEKQSLHFLPRARIRYRLNDAFITLDASRSLSRLRLENSFTQNFINSERSVYSNIPSLDLIKGFNIRLGFYTSGEDILFKSFNTTIGYSRTNGLYLSRIQANQNIVSSINEFSSGSTESLQLNSNFSRYWGKSKLRLEIAPYATYSIQPLALNTDSSNEVQSFLSGASLNLNSSLIDFLKVAYEADLRYNYSVIENNTLEFAGLGQNINLRIKFSRKLWLRFIYDIQIPDFRRNESFAFFDAEISFKLIPKVSSYIIGNNLLNTKQIQTNSIDAFSRVTSIQIVQPRYLGLRFEFDLL